jgi:hypothetical protein
MSGSFECLSVFAEGSRGPETEDGQRVDNQMTSEPYLTLNCRV